MRRLFDIYLHQFKVTLAIQFQYRAGLMIWMLEVVLEPLIYLVVWQSAAGGNAIGGFEARDFAAYYTVLLIVQHFTQTWNMWEFEWRVRTGEMNSALILPLHPIHPDIASNITYKLLMLIVVVPSVIMLVLVFDPLFETPLWAALAFIPVLLVAGALAFMIGYVVALAAFWTVRITAINQVYFLGMLFFSGYIAPLDLLPEVLQRVADLLPFQWFLAFPVELFLGRVSPQDALIGFGIQLAWLAAAVALLLVVWRQAVRRYSAVGG